ncbi:DUF4037 domain-containing protein [Lacrimispora brassicae]
MTGNFIKGLDLCEQFFNDIAKPVLNKHFSSTTYSAGLIGYGSDVLGFDDEISTDHMWGPRFYLFLREKDITLKNEILDTFAKEFPYEYKGYSVNFSTPGLNDGGIRQPEFISNGVVSPLVFIHTISEYLNTYLGVGNFDNLSELDWLTFSEHRLLTLTSGKLFLDGLNIHDLLEKTNFYPESVKLFLIASNWSLIAEEQAFVRRCYDVGDELGSVLACSRIAERLIRLSFLYCNQYAPYSKWFGKAFGLLPIDKTIKTTIFNAVTATNIEDRENRIVLAQKLLADLHNKLKITEFVNVDIESYYGRNIKVIFADKLFDAVAKRLKGTPLAGYPFIGTMSEVSNFVTLSDEPKYIENIKALYIGHNQN